MMEKKGGDDEIAEKRETAAAASADSPDPKKRKMAPVDGASGADVCDDVAVNILARVPARTAVACMALSKHHRRLIRSPEFRSLHLRLAPPLSRHQIAYVATAPIRRQPEHKPVRVFHGFHVAAGAAGISGGNNDPVRVVSGGRYLGTMYANTCNGVVLLSGEEFSALARCIRWNPAVADDAKEVTVPYSLRDSTYSWREREYLTLALGYGRRSEAYKLLVCRRKDVSHRSHCPGRGRRYEYSLMFYLLGESENPKRPPKLAVLPAREERIKPINLKSMKTLYMEGTIYLVQFDEPVVLAFDVDEETVSTIDLPGKHPGRAELLEMSGRPCVVANDGRTRTSWLLTVDHQWERRCVLSVENNRYRLDDLLYCQINGVWDCGDVLVLLLKDMLDMLCLYHVATEKMYKTNLPGDLTSEWGDYALCWGYRPSLVSPGSIVDKLNRGKEPCRESSVEIMQILNPVKEQEMRKGRKATLNTVCVMEFLAYIMRKLPDDMQNMIEMPLINSEYSISFSEHKVVLEDEAGGSAAADGDDDDDTDVDSVSDSDSASASEPESESP